MTLIINKAIEIRYTQIDKDTYTLLHYDNNKSQANGWSMHSAINCFLMFYPKPITLDHIIQVNEERTLKQNGNLILISHCV